MNLLLIGLLAVAPPRPGPDVELEDYVVQPGDSCAAISKRRFGKRKLYSIIHEHNDLGPLPHDLVPGTILRLPTSPPKDPDAEVTQTERNVQARAPKNASWAKAPKGLDLYRGWRVNTLERSSAEVTFRDNTQIFLRENTLVIIYGDATTSSRRRQTTTARLDKGALRSSLASLSGKPTVKVDTPSSETTLVGGNTLVTVDDAGASRIANHGDGTAAVVSKTKKRRKVKVARGYGSKVEKGREPTKPKPLPATPAWDPSSPEHFVVAHGGVGSIRGAWTPIDGVHEYRVELGQDKTGGFVSTSVVVPGTVHDFEVHGVPPGKHFAIVSSVDGDAFESIPSRMHHATLYEVALSAPGGTAVQPAAPAEAGQAPPPVPVLLGSSLTAPDGWSCAFGDGPRAAGAVATEEGPAKVECWDASGQRAPGFEVVVTAVNVRPLGALPGGVVIAPAASLDVALALDSQAPVPDSLEVRGTGGLTVDKLERSGEELRFTLHAGAHAQSGSLALVVGDREVGAIDVTVGSAPASTRSTEEPQPDDDEDPWIERWAPTPHLVELGVFGGAFIPDRGLELFTFDPALPELGFKPLARVAPTVGARVGYAPIRYFGVEVDGSVMPSSIEGDPAVLWTARGSAIAQLGRWSTTPFISGGMGLLSVASPGSVVGSDIDAAIHFGLGLKVFTTKRFMMRLDVQDTLSGRRGIGGGIAHSFAITIGGGLTLGRKEQRR